MDDLRLGGVASLELAYDSTLPHDESAVADRERLLDLRGAGEDGHSLAGELAAESVDFRLRADVDAARGIVQDEQLRADGEPFGEEDLLLVPAAQGHDRFVHGVGRDAQPLHPVTGYGPLFTLIHQATIHNPVKDEQRGVAADRPVHEEPFVSAACGDVGDSLADPVSRGAKLEGPAIQQRPPAGRAFEAEEELEQLVDARSLQTSKADDLARRRLEAE